MRKKWPDYFYRQENRIRSRTKQFIYTNYSLRETLRLCDLVVKKNCRSNSNKLVEYEQDEFIAIKGYKDNILMIHLRKFEIWNI